MKDLIFLQKFCDFCFDEMSLPLDTVVTREHLTAHVLFLYFKERFTERMKRESIPKHYIHTDSTGDSDNEARRIRRSAEKVLRAQTHERNCLGLTGDNYLPQLEKKKDRRGMAAPQQEFSYLDFLAFENQSKQSGIRLITMGDRILDAKKVSGQEIYTAYQELDVYIEKQSKEKDDTKWLYNLFDLASLEGSTLLGFVYFVAAAMDAYDVDDVPSEILTLCDFREIFPNIRSQSRFLNFRHCLVPSFFDPCTRSERHDYIFKVRQASYIVKRILTIEYQESTDVQRATQELLENPAILRTYFSEWYNLFSVLCFPATERDPITKEDGFSARRVKRIRTAFRTLTNLGEHESVLCSE